jgi:NTP pyrophosphatase (non-canonical NTP hydrolase)
MTFAEYVEASATTVAYPAHQRFLYPALKLVGESGEVVEKFGKAIRDGNWTPGTPLPTEWSNAIALELGDVLWYAAALTREFHLNADMLASSLEYGRTGLLFLDPGNFRPFRLGCFLVEGATSMLREVLVIGAPTPAEFLRDEDAEIFALLRDVLYGIAGLADAINVPVDDIMRLNVEKLQSRRNRGVIHGSGDAR